MLHTILRLALWAALLPVLAWGQLPMRLEPLVFTGQRAEPVAHDVRLEPLVFTGQRTQPVSHEIGMDSLVFVGLRGSDGD